MKFPYTLRIEIILQTIYILNYFTSAKALISPLSKSNPTTHNDDKPSHVSPYPRIPPVLAAS